MPGSRVEWDLPLQRREFVQPEEEFHDDRPQVALEMETPAAVYRASARQYPSRLPGMEYGSTYYVRRVHWQGRFLWSGERLALSRWLAGEWVGLKEGGEDFMGVTYGPVLLGWLDHPTGIFVRTDRAEKWAASSLKCQSTFRPRKSIATLLQMNECFLHQSLNCNPVLPAIQLISSRILRHSTPVSIRHALKVSFGFGDVNACLVFRSPTAGNAA